MAAAEDTRVCQPNSLSAFPDLLKMAGASAQSVSMNI
jgi:hypothetical protein